MERGRVADALQPAAFNEGESVVKQGESGDDFFIIMEGEAEVFQVKPDSEDPTPINVGSLKASDYFGTRATSIYMLYYQIYNLSLYMKIEYCTFYKWRFLDPNSSFHTFHVRPW